MSCASFTPCAERFNKIILGRELRATKDEGQNESSILRGLIRDLEADLAEDRKELEANDDAISAKLTQAEQNLQVH